MKQSPARLALVLLFLFIGCFGTAYAAAGMLTAMPAPAVGGTCGPSTGSETALEALAKPGSIGAGPQPPTSNVTAHQQWKTFIDQCQSLADRRGLASLAIFVISLAVASIGLIWVLRRPRTDRDGDESVDGSTDWPVDPGTGVPAQLVGAGAVIAAPGAALPGTWGEPAAPAAYPPQPPSWTAGPAAPAPYPYGPPPVYPAQAAYPSAPGYPPPPPPPPAHPAYPPAAPPAYPVAPAPPAPPAHPVGPAAVEPTPTAESDEEPPAPLG